jgi:hypothetical protein
VPKPDRAIWLTLKRRFGNYQARQIRQQNQLSQNKLSNEQKNAAPVRRGV